MATETPWATDLASAFPDPEVQAQVDSFLRERIQPYVTSVEERAALAGDVQEFWNQWTENPGETWNEMTKELVGDEKAAEVLALIQGTEPSAPATPAAPATEAPPTTGQALPPQYQEALDEFIGERQTAKYDKAVNEFIAAHPDAGVKRELFDPFVASAEGNLEAALEGYTAWATAAQAEFGPPPPEGEAPAPAPPALTGETGGVSTPPTEKDYGRNIDAAVDDFFNEQKASAPPVVGTA